MIELLLVGGGGHCKAVADVVLRSGKWSVAGLVERRDAPVDLSNRFPILGFDDDLSKLREKYRYALVCIGQIKTAFARERAFNALKHAGFELPTLVSPTAMVSPSSQIGEGTVVMDFAMVATHARLGANCIANSKSLIEHECRIGDHCHISTGAILNGAVTVGSRTFVGSGSICKQGISIGSDCIVGMGVLARHDLPDGLTFTG